MVREGRTNRIGRGGKREEEKEHTHCTLVHINI